MDEVEFYLADLASRFPRNRSDYYLSYSGGKDSHFLYWFIKEYLHDSDIQIVAVNTYMEHPQISARMYKYADIVLLPKMKPMEVKEKYGSPCFSKIQDEYIMRYQKGCRTESLMKRINGFEFVGTDQKEYKSLFTLNKTARRLLLSGELHRVSPLCCKKLKKETLHRYEKKSGKKAILGVRSDESRLRRAKYKSCFSKNGTFTPLHDLSDELLNAIYERYQIEVPSVYQYTSRTGCMGCPYGSYKGETEKELELLSPAQQRFVIELFRESYDVLGIDYRNIQQKLF